jgi:hypothetical protein
MRVVRPGKKVASFIIINGQRYDMLRIPYKASIPERFFKQAAGVKELKEWLEENKTGVYFIDFANNIVQFECEEDAVLFKMVLG